MIFLRCYKGTYSSDCATRSNTDVQIRFHHDVKPDNVLTLGESNQGSGSVTFKIADLGLTRFRADLGLNARIIDPGGTRAYGTSLRLRSMSQANVIQEPRKRRA